MTSSTLDKIVGKQGLIDAVCGWRRRRRRIVLCHGCFDIVHPGHIRHLEFARKHGDVLVVSITGDAAIDKAADRPYIPQELRAENLAALGCVDQVYIDPHHTAEDVLRTVKPDVYVKGKEYQTSKAPRFLEEQKIVEAHHGRVIFSSGDVVYSSTELIRRVGRDADLETRRLLCLCQRHDITMDTLDHVTERIGSCRVVVVGDVLIDRYRFCDAVDVARESPMMALRQLEEQTYLGGAAVVAQHVRRLGADVCLVSSFGRDDASRGALERLQASGIETFSMQDRGSLVVKTRYLVEDKKLFKVECGDPRPLDSRAVRKAGRVILEQAADTAGVIFCDFGYGAVTGGLLADLLPPLRRQVEVITADVSGRSGNLLNFTEVDLFCPTEREMRATLHEFDEGLSTVAWELMNRTRARHLIATLGRRGLVAFDRQTQDPSEPDWGGRLRSEHLQALSNHAVDVLGCGDSLLAGCTLALGCGADFIQAAYLGSAMAAIEAGQLGNVPIDLEELRRWLSTRPELLARSLQTAP